MQSLVTGYPRETLTRLSLEKCNGPGKVARKGGEVYKSISKT